MTDKLPPAHKRLKIEAKRWPWQAGYNWHGMLNSTAPLNQPRPGEKAAPRFGGGWKYELGFSYGGGRHGWTLMLNLLFGFVVVSYTSAEAWRAQRERERKNVEALARLKDDFEKRERRDAEARAAQAPFDDFPF